MAKCSVQYAPEALGLIRSALEPGEEISAICDFSPVIGSMPDGQLLIRGTTFTAVLVQERIVFLGFSSRGFWKPKIELTGESSMQLVDIKSTSKARTRFNGQDIWVIGVAGQQWASKYDEAETFRDALEFVLKHRRKRTEVSGGRSVSAELASLRELVDTGVLSEADWEQAKASFLGKPLNRNDAAANSIRKLYELNREGMITDSEFRQKKWDILSRS